MFHARDESARSTWNAGDLTANMYDPPDMNMNHVLHTTGTSDHELSPIKWNIFDQPRRRDLQLTDGQVYDTVDKGNECSLMRPKMHSQNI